MPSKCSHVIVLRVYFASFLIHSYDGYKSLWFVPAPNLLNLHLFPVPLPQPALSALSGSFQQPHLPPSAPTSTASWTITSPSCSSLVHKKSPNFWAQRSQLCGVWSGFFFLVFLVLGMWRAYMPMLRRVRLELLPALSKTDILSRHLPTSWPCLCLLHWKDALFLCSYKRDPFIPSQHLYSVFSCAEGVCLRAFPIRARNKPCFSTCITWHPALPLGGAQWLSV